MQPHGATRKRSSISAKMQNTLTVWDVDLRILRETLEADPALMRVLGNPETSLAERERLIAAALFVVAQPRRL